MEEHARSCRAMMARFTNGRGRASILIEIDIDARGVDVETVLRCSETAVEAARIVSAYEAIEGSIARIVAIAVAEQFKQGGDEHESSE